MHTVEYVKKKELLKLAATWMNLKNIMLSERNQKKKTTYCMTQFILNAQKRQIYRQKVY